MAGAFASASVQYQPLPSALPAAQHEILLLEPEPLASAHATALRHTCRVVSTAHGDVAKQYLVKGGASLVIVDTDVECDAVEVVRAARSLPAPATVLVLAPEVAIVPDVLLAGCNAVLLKPFAPNLLYTRVGRLLRARSALQLRAAWNERADGGGAAPTTNRAWPDAACPSCDRGGAVSFEFASYRRAWYACLACKHVWVAKRRE